MKFRSQGRDYVGSSRVRRKSKRSSEVMSEPAEKSQSLPEKLVETCQENRHDVQELAGVGKIFGGDITCAVEEQENKIPDSQRDVRRHVNIGAQNPRN